MDGGPVVWVFSTMALVESVFWGNVAACLKKDGHAVVFLCFDDRSAEYLAGLGFDVYTTNMEDRRLATERVRHIEASLAEYRIDSVNFWLEKERLAFGLRDRGEMTLRLLTYLTMADRCFAKLLATHQPFIVQETSASLNAVGIYFAGRKYNIDHWFVEPSFFKGRLFLIKNSFAAIRVPEAGTVAADTDVKAYLDHVKSNKIMVIPTRDQHFFRPAGRKLFNVRNIRRMAEKLVDKYVLKKEQGYGYIWNHFTQHLRMFVNSLRLTGTYTPLTALDRFVYYPLHAPDDVALVIRSPQFLDQIALVDHLARSLPTGFQLAVKEHPAMRGAIHVGRLKAVLQKHAGLVVVVDPATNNFDVTGRSAAVVTVNSKAGAEAILLGKPTMVLGDAFYRNCAAATAVSSSDALATDLTRLVKQRKVPESHQTEGYFERVWLVSDVGELGVSDSDNVLSVARSVQRAARAE